MRAEVIFFISVCDIPKPFLIFAAGLGFSTRLGVDCSDAAALFFVHWIQRDNLMAKMLYL